MDIFYNMINTFEFTVIFRITIITILSGIIGLEREAWNKPAGFKTHTLVGISATLVMLCGQYLSSISNADPSRIAAQLLSGIGFVGAGTILRDGFNVKGLTTAASLLTVTCIGLSVGAGFYVGAVITTIIVFVILSHSRKLIDRVEKYNLLNLKIETSESEKTIKDLEKIFTKYQVLIDKIILDNEKKSYIELAGKYKEDIDKNKILSSISIIDEVKKVEDLNP